MLHKAGGGLIRETLTFTITDMPSNMGERGLERHPCWDGEEELPEDWCIQHNGWN